MRRIAVGLVLAAGALLPVSAFAQDQDHRRPNEGGRWHGGPGAHARAEGPAGQPGPNPAPAPPPRPAPAPGQPPLADRAPDGRGADRFGDRRFGGEGFRGGGYGGGDRADMRAFARQPGNRDWSGARRPGDRIDDPARGGPEGWDRHNPRPDRGGPPIAPGSGGYRAQPGQPGYRGEGFGHGYPTPFGGHGGYPAGGYRPAPPRPNPAGGWNRGWRDDRRYDFRSYRVHNSYVFNLGRYDAPRGWHYGYRRFSPGFTLNSFLFDQDYWIEDPYAYRLPPAWGPYRWVRYYGDALLVDVRSGEVVDAVYGIFW